MRTGWCGLTTQYRFFVRSVYDVFPMDVESFREYCLNKPHVTEGTPFGEDVLVFKVGGKIFALASLDEIPSTANLKCDPDLALELRDRYEQVRHGYHMNKKHWNTLEIDSGIPDVELRKMIDHSYDLVAKSLPKATRTKLKLKS
jgi:predicted DNA-binding protein (MmcQ/YjbR family)